eukprot:scaffold1652_cov394-Prasinococcus_capsulatus_cf.AAC.3
MEPQMSDQQLYELSVLAGVPMNREVFDAVLELVKMDVVPTALHQVCEAPCSRRQGTRAGHVTQRWHRWMHGRS